MSLIEILVGVLIMILSGFGTVIMLNFKEIKDNFRTMAESVVQLNIKLERVITEQIFHRKDMDRLEERIELLENKE